jgi:hypothetical protein
VPTPAATATHRPIAHHQIVEALVETLGYRQIGVVNEECAVSPDGMKMFEVFDLATGFEGCRFAIGIRNSHDKSFRLAITTGLRVLVCENMAFHRRVHAGDGQALLPAASSRVLFDAMCGKSLTPSESRCTTARA